MTVTVEPAYSEILGVGDSEIGVSKMPGEKIVLALSLGVLRVKGNDESRVAVTNRNVEKFDGRVRDSAVEAESIVYGWTKERKQKGCSRERKVALI